MITTDFDIEQPPLLVLSPTTSHFSEIIQKELLPGGDEDEGLEENDWTDIDDEDFEDWAEDEEEFHQSEEDNNIFDPEDDDHLPEDEDF